MTIQEIALRWDSEELDANIDYVNGDLELEQSFLSSVIISLFTDARAADDDILPDYNNTDKRGWWGDLAEPEATGDETGSLLWLLERSKTEPEVLARAKQYIYNALQWLIDDGLVSKIEVTIEKQPMDEDINDGGYRLAFKVDFYFIEEALIEAGISSNVETVTYSSSSSDDIVGTTIITFDGINGLTFNGISQIHF